MFKCFSLLLFGTILLHAADAVGPLQGKVWRGNNARTGEFHTQGIAHQAQEQWTFATGAAIKSSPVIVDQRVFIGSDDGTLYALNATDGSLLWSYPTNKPIRSSVAVYNGTVFFTNGAGMHALNEESGEVLWTIKRGLWDDSVAVIPGPIQHNDTTLDGVVLYSQPWKGLVGVHSKDGTEVWRLRDTHGPGKKGCSVALHRGMATFFRGSQATVMVDLKTERRRYEIDGAVDNGVFTPACRDGICYSYIRGVVAFDLLENAAIKGAGNDKRKYNIAWTFTKSKKENWDYQHPGVSSFSVDDKNVYFGHRDTYVYALDRSTGTPAWKTQTGGPNLSSPALDNGNLLYIGSEDTHVYAIDRSNGNIQWKYATGGAITSSPALLDGTLFIGSDDGKVYALH